MSFCETLMSYVFLFELSVPEKAGSFLLFLVRTEGLQTRPSRIDCSLGCGILPASSVGDWGQGYIGSAGHCRTQAMPCECTERNGPEEGSEQAAEKPTEAVPDLNPVQVCLGK